VSSRIRPPPRLARKLLISLAALVLALGLAEIGMRVWLVSRGRPYDSGIVKQRLVRAADPIRAFVPGLGGKKAQNGDGSPMGILHPYSGAEVNHDSGGVLAHFRSEPTNDEYTVLIVGGSVAASFAESVSGDLEQALARDPRLAGQRVRVLDYAHAAYKEPQQLMRVAYLLSMGFRPDAVINIDGFNEVALGYENATNGTNPLYPSFPIWGSIVQDFGAVDSEALDRTLELWQLRGRVQELVDRALRWRLYKSALLGRITLVRLAAYMDRRNELQGAINAKAMSVVHGSKIQRQLQGPDFDTERDSAIRQCAQNWYESSLSLHALCKSRGAVYLHVLQPTLHDPGSKPLTDVERALDPGPDAWRPGVVLGYPLLRQRARELAENGVHVLDATRAFADAHETLYYDACHFQKPGNEILERLIAQYFIDHVLEVPTPAPGDVAATVPANGR
jgi:hypothetical protein